MQSCTVTLLLAAHLALRLAVLPHAHGTFGETQRSHADSRPHVHLAWLQGEEHSHGHGHEHSHRHDAPQPPKDDPTLGDCGHDGDAVYLPHDSVVQTMSKASVEPSGLDLTLVPANALSMSPADVMAASPVEQFSVNRQPNCPLFVTLRALRL